MSAEFGFCAICNKEIAKACAACGVRKVGGDYTEVQVQWSNGSKMNIAVCLDCSKKPIGDAEKKTVTEAHFAAWERRGGIFDKGVVLV